MAFSTSNLSRRALLKSLGATAAHLPLFKLLDSSVARAADAPPLRFLALFSPHGTCDELWRPKGGETDFNLNFTNSILAPLQNYNGVDYRSKLIILDGIDYRVLHEKQETGHEGGLVTFLTGSSCLKSGHDAVPKNLSLDQHLASLQTTKIRSLELGVYKEAGDSSLNTMCYGPNGRRLQNRINPTDVFTDLFSGYSPSADEAAVRRTLLRKKSVLDFVTADLQRMSNRLSGTEKQKLDQHFTAVRDIERRLLAPAPGCSLPLAPTLLDPERQQNIPAITQLQLDLITQAFACDLTRVATLQFLSCGPDLAMPWAGVNEDAHVVVHRVNEEGAAGREARLANGRIQRWFATQFAYLLEKLDAIKEADGSSVLDHTVILWGNELGDPGVHDNVNIPMVLAGGGFQQMGRCLRLSQNWNPNPHSALTPHNKVLVSICRAFGLDVNTYGDTDYTGPLPGLV